MKGLNPGIRMTVGWLNAHGFKTTDSGDGKTNEFECDLPIPYVHMLVEPEQMVDEAKRLVSLVEAMGVKLEPLNEEGDIPTVDASYNPISGLSCISLWNVDDALLFGSDQ